MQQRKLYYIMNFFFAMAVAGIMMQVPYFSSLKFGASYTQLSYFMLLYGPPFIVLSIIMGHLGSHWGKGNLMMTVGCFCMFGVAIILFFSRNMTWIYAAILACAVSASLFVPNMVGMMGQASSMRTISRQTAGYNIGWAVPHVIAPVLSGKLLDIFNRWLGMPQLMFPIMGSLVLVAAIISFKIHKVDIEQKMPETAELEPQEHHKVLTSGRIFMFLGWFAFLMVYSPIAIVHHLFPKHGASLGFSATQVGILLGTVGVFQLVVFLLSRKIHSWHFRYSLFYISAVLMISAMLLISFFESFYMMVMPLALCGIASACVFQMGVFYSLVAAKNKGRASGIIMSVEYLGMLVMLMIAGWAINVTGDVSAGYFTGMKSCLIFLLGIFVITMVMLLKKRFADKGLS